MTQPETGKKLADLRKDKGLTQEQLAEKCKVNVRTIQRIESGEVMPRSSTLRLIIEALEHDWQSFSREIDPETSTVAQQPKPSILKNLQIAWIAGIVYFMLGFPESLTEMAAQYGGSFTPGPWLYGIIKVFTMITFLFFIRGFIIAGTLNRKTLLTLSAYIYLCVLLIDYSIDIVMYSSDSTWTIMDGIVVKGITYGFTAILFGIGLIRMEDISGRVAVAAGILEIAIGITFLTIIFFMAGLVLMVPAEILEIYILFKYTESLRSVKVNHVPV